MNRSIVGLATGMPASGVLAAPHAGRSADSRWKDLTRLRPVGLLTFFRSQPFSFWLLNFYLFIEYVRPQQVWPAIDVLPWGLVSLLGTLAAFAMEGRSPRLPTALGTLLLCFAGVVVLSSVLAIEPSAAYQKWELFFTWVLVFVLIANIVTTDRRYLLFLLAFLLYSFKMSQHGFRTWMSNGFGFSDWGATGGPGWFHNSGEFGIQMCIFLPLSVEFILGLQQNWPRWQRALFYVLPITAVASIIASSSRGAVVGGAAVALWWVLRSKHRVRTLAAVAVLAAVAWAVVPQEQKDRFSTAGDDETSVSRIERWEAGIEMANERPVLGIGYNNWTAVYGPLSHNIFIEALAELGYVGLLAFLGLITGTFVVNRRTRNLATRSGAASAKFIQHAAHGLDGALIGYLVSGFFVTVLYYPFFWVNLAMTAALHVAAKNLNPQHPQPRRKRRGPPMPGAPALQAPSA